MNALPTDFQRFIHVSRYARWVEDEQRRETFPETVDRYLSFMVDHLRERHGYTLPISTVGRLREAILRTDVMPSMRALMTAGPALARDHTAAYNCSYLRADKVVRFVEAMRILLCGTGVGFSVERQYVNKLPRIPSELVETDHVIVVEDSKEGWGDALQELLECLYGGVIPSYDTTLVRPAGARLKTFGGRASGPEPLEELFDFIIGIFKEAAGRKLTSIECHDILCKIGEVVVVGGVRRSAMISLSNLSDERMRHAKSGQWWEATAWRALANNSACYTDKPEIGVFMQEWLALYESKSGERGIFNREASIQQAAKNGRRVIGYTDEGEAVTSIHREGVTYIDFGTNPCSEIILRPHQFCNLSEVVVRANDTFETLKEKVELATILGTMQSTLTDFPYLTEEWKRNTEEERLLGVSMTGIMDNVLTSGVGQTHQELGHMLDRLREHAVAVNEAWAELLGIQQSAAITCVKPSGTVSQLVDSASGIHARHAPYFIRTVRADNKDPLTDFMKDMGIPHEPCFMKPDSTTVFSFPMKSPDDAVTRNDMTAIEQLELWLTYQRHWCEHKPSVTISVREPEWMEVGAWVYEHFDEVSGISFLPHSEHTYKQAPYQDCTEQQYLDAVAQMPKDIDWFRLREYEKEDNTSGSQTMACTAGACEIVDLT